MTRLLLVWLTAPFAATAVWVLICRLSRSDPGEVDTTAPDPVDGWCQQRVDDEFFGLVAGLDWNVA